MFKNRKEGFFFLFFSTYTLYRIVSVRQKGYIRDGGGQAGGYRIDPVDPGSWFGQSSIWGCCCGCSSPHCYFPFSVAKAGKIVKQKEQNIVSLYGYEDSRSMKNFLCIAVLVLVCFPAFAQQKQDTVYYYEPRRYNVPPCGCSLSKERDSTFIENDTLKLRLILFKEAPVLSNKKPFQLNEVFSFILYDD